MSRSPEEMQIRGAAWFIVGPFEVLLGKAGQTFSPKGAEMWAVKSGAVGQKRPSFETLLGNHIPKLPSGVFMITCGPTHQRASRNLAP